MEFGVLVFVEGGKPENLKKDSWSKARANIQHTAGIKPWPQKWEGVPSPLRHPCSPQVVLVGSNNLHFICHTAQLSLHSILSFRLDLTSKCKRFVYLCLGIFVLWKSSTDERTRHTFMNDNQHGI